LYVAATPDPETTRTRPFAADPIHHTARGEPPAVEISVCIPVVVLMTAMPWSVPSTMRDASGLTSTARGSGVTLPPSPDAVALRFTVPSSPMT
jgi:hypothetical protein